MRVRVTPGVRPTTFTELRVSDPILKANCAILFSIFPNKLRSVTFQNRHRVNEPANSFMLNEGKCGYHILCLSDEDNLLYAFYHL
jgi:hypothetical protein